MFEFNSKFSLTCQPYTNTPKKQDKCPQPVNNWAVPFQLFAHLTLSFGFGSSPVIPFPKKKSIFILFLMLSLSQKWPWNLNKSSLSSIFSTHLPSPFPFSFFLLVFPFSFKTQTWLHYKIFSAKQIPLHFPLSSLFLFPLLSSVFSFSWLSR